METNTQPPEEDDNKKTEELLKKILTPLRPIVMFIQSLLVWEYPRRSAVLFFCVHGIFWYFSSADNQYYFMISSSLFVLYMTHKLWKNRIWPGKKDPPKQEVSESWVEVNPPLLSVPEICQYIAQILGSVYRCAVKCWTFKRSHPYVFYFLSCAFIVCLVLAGIFMPISGFMLTYIIVISTLLWPSFLYHNLLQRVYLKFEPIFMKLEYSIKLKSKWSFKSGKSTKSDGNLGDRAETDSDTDDFCPTLDPETTAALARAITDSEDESNTPSLSTPYCLSKEPSIELDEEEEKERHKDFESDFMSGITEMPSIDDNLDLTDDEILEPTPIKPKSSNKDTKKAEGIDFVTEHFGDSSDSDEETLIKDLKFPDVNDASLNAGSDADKNVAMVASEIVSKTLSSVMGSALSGITNLTPNIMTRSAKPSNPDELSNVAFSTGDSSVNIQASQKSDQGAADGQQQVAMESSDIDIAEEFEFLDKYELEDTRE